MTQFVFANGVQTTLAAAITATDTTLVVSSTANLPTIAAGQQCPAVLGTTALFEIVYITNINSSTLTITRGQENTAAQSWGLGTQFEISVTAGSIAAAQIIGTLGGALTGTLPNPGIGSGVVTGTNIAGSTITEGNMASGAIHRAQLSTATASSEIAIGGNANYNFAMVGGAYSYHGVSATGSGSGTTSNIIVFGAGGNVGLGNLGFLNSSTAGGTEYAWINENYINSSPPYNFGESFVYVAYDKDGKIVGISAALDPTWAHHGPHDIVPKFWKQRGKVMVPYTHAKTVEGMLLPVAKKDRKIRLALFKHELTPVVTEQEITIDYKDADMHTHPHPFGSDSVARVVLMHPDSLVANDVTDWLKEGSAAEIVTMIEDGDLIPGTDLIAHPYSPIPTVKFKVR